MNRRPAFTLIEMLTVIGILTCLTGLLVPVLTVTKDIAEQTFCAANLSNIGTALYVYADNHAGFLPDCGASSTLGGPVPADGKHFADAWDSPGTARYPSVQSAGNQGNLWLLVREGYLSAAAFTCPSTADSPSLNPADDVAITGFYQMDAAGSQPTPAEAQFLQDFSAGRCSYSFQNQFVHPDFDESVAPRTNGRTHLAQHSPRLAIAADRNPYTRVRITNQRICSPADNPEANSPNHAGEGQNVLYLSGAVRWHATPYAGAWRQDLDRKDNIYRADEGDPTDPQNVPRHLLDSYLVP